LDIYLLVKTVILLPAIGGIICLFIPNRKRRLIEIIALTLIIINLIAAVNIFLTGNQRVVFERFPVAVMDMQLDFIVDALCAFVLIGISFFGVVIIVYSIGWLENIPRLKEYYTYILFTIGMSSGAVLANNFIVMLFFFGIIALLLYLLVGINNGDAASAASKKTLIIVGSTDVLMIIGVCIVYYLSKNMTISEVSIPVNGILTGFAFIFMISAAFAKAGAMPFHTWIPSIAETAPVSVLAFLPASLDKLLGIYLLARLVLNVFVIGTKMGFLLMFIGAFTIVSAVMMALVQHNLKKLLSFHAISQVGYMVLGIGTGTPIGIVGGLFHMINHAIYKSCLFLCGGAVEKETGTSELERLGGLVHFMPVVCITCTVAALSISGVPPFNGFASKWLVYQAVITKATATTGIKAALLWMFLVAAMFGSALTLASFVKVLHSLFFSKKPSDLNDIKSPNWFIKIPLIILALLCVFFGIFMWFPLKVFIAPVLGGDFIYFDFGLWRPVRATVLILISLGAGFLIYLFRYVRTLEVKDVFVGGETLDEESIRIPGTHFYGPIKSLSFLKGLYDRAEKGYFDIYNIGKNIASNISGALSIIHTGILSTYLLWILAGLVVLLLISKLAD